MTNLEKYFGKLDSASMFIKDFKLSCRTAQLRKSGSFTDFDCKNIGCGTCREDNIKWLLSEYEPPELKNGDGLKPGQEIEVSWEGEGKWYTREFIAYFDGLFWCRNNSIYAVGWEHARLKRHY